MRITWFGHAAFLVEAAGLRVVLDPYRSPDCGGYAPIDVAADVVVVSHENDRYHSHLGQIRPPFEVVRALEAGPGGIAVRGVRFDAVPCFETPEKLPGDEVSIVHFRLEGRHVVHLGDLGHPLEPEEIARLHGADVLLIPAGGPPTLDFPHVGPLVKALEPTLVVPMHYLIPGKINLKIQPVERFLEELPDWPVERLDTSTLELPAHTAIGPSRVVVLEPAC